METPKYKNPSLPLEERVEDLLSRMTLEEKFEQIHCPGCGEPWEVHLERAKNGINSVHSSIYTYTAYEPSVINALQNFCVNKTRLGIPLLVATEGTHGLSVPCATIFPTTGCIAATFDETYAYKMAVAEAEEARALGFNQVYAPTMDILRDPRWGRSEENYGEDPLLSSKMAVAVVKGLQENGVCATLKHYIAYGAPQKGINLSAVSMGEREIREYMLKPFADCVKAGAWGLMPGYHDVDGVPMHVNKFWMSDVLRDELGFNGFVITDYGASGLLYTKHNAVYDALDMGKAYLETQIGLEACGIFGYGPELMEAVERGEVPVEKIDRAVKQVLRAKIALGLFEHPFFDEQKSHEHVFTTEHRELCREIEEKGAVLLKNDGVLPFKKSGVKKIALIGPNAEIAQPGSYCYYSARDKDKNIVSVSDLAITPKQALIAKFGEQNVTCECGCGFADFNEERAAKALEIAKQADVVVFAGGHNSIAIIGGDEGGVGSIDRDLCDAAITSGEGYDTNDTDLSKPQKMLLGRLRECGKPVVLVIYGGKPVSITDELDGLNAVMLAFGVGSDGNVAVADLLNGDAVPAGRLPFSIPRYVGNLPCYYNHKEQGLGNHYNRHGSYEHPGMDYVFCDPDPLFEFGYGLSYTKFEYSDIIAKKREGGWSVSVNVKNVGDYDADESVLVFSRNLKQRFVSPIVKKLVAFKRKTIPVGKTEKYEFFLTKDDFAYVGIDMKKTYVKGEVKLFIADKELIINED